MDFRVRAWPFHSTVEARKNMRTLVLLVALAFVSLPLGGAKPLPRSMEFIFPSTFSVVFVDQTLKPRWIG